MLEALHSDIVPRLLKDVPRQPTDEQLQADPYLSRFVIIFDREGYSPAFFRQMWQDHRIACITYHKYPKDAWPEAMVHRDGSHPAQRRSRVDEVGGDGFVDR
jgi:hypothetical protein